MSKKSEKEKRKEEVKKSFTQWGDSVLTTPTKLVELDEIKTPKFQAKIDTMFEMMEGVGWGLAANQIGWDKSVAVVEIKPIEKYPNWSVVPPTVLINPEILERSDEVIYSWEACLSCPVTTMFYVPRAKWIKVKYLDRNGESIENKLDRLASTVFQHEIDHLNGITCGERVLIVDGKVARGAIRDFSEYKKEPNKIPEGAKHLVKSGINNREQYGHE